MIENLRKEFRDTYGIAISTTNGVEELAGSIGISKNSLRRFLGKLNDSSNLRVSTLNLIAEKLGYQSFQDFCSSYAQKDFSVDFPTLDIYYGCVLGKGTKIGDANFQKANYYFAEKILGSPDNLKEFLRRYSENQEALEYVLAWHPSYSLIADADYQKILLRIAKNSQHSHIKVFAEGFIFFGKFMSDKLSHKEAKSYITKLRKRMRKMRANNAIWVFPEARYAVAECIFAVMNGAEEDEISEIINKEIPKNLSFGELLIYSAFVADILNFFGFYQTAENLLKRIFNFPYKIQDFEIENPHHIPQIALAKTNWGLALFHNGYIKESDGVFREVMEMRMKFHKSSFDSSDFLDLRFYELAHYHDPKNMQLIMKIESYKEKLNFIISKH